MPRLDVEREPACYGPCSTYHQENIMKIKTQVRAGAVDGVAITDMG